MKMTSSGQKMTYQKIGKLLPTPLETNRLAQESYQTSHRRRETNVSHLKSHAPWPEKTAIASHPARVIQDVSGILQANNAGVNPVQNAEEPSRDEAPGSDYTDRPGRRPGLPGNARRHARPHRFEPYGRSRVDPSHRPRRETDDMHTARNVTTFGRTKHIPEQLQRADRAKLQEIEVRMAEVKRQMHERGEREMEEGQNERLLEGTRLELLWQMEMEEMVEKAGEVNNGRG
jgi:hypothetical protein